QIFFNYRLLAWPVCGGFLAVGFEVESGSQSLVSLVRLLVGEAVGVTNSTFKDGADQFRVFPGRVQPDTPEGVVVKPSVGEEIVDRLHLGDMGQIVVGFRPDVVGCWLDQAQARLLAV